MLLRENLCGRNFSGKASSAQCGDCLVSSVFAVVSSCLDLSIFSPGFGLLGKHCLQSGTRYQKG